MTLHCHLIVSTTTVTTFQGIYDSLIRKYSEQIKDAKRFVYAAHARCVLLCGPRDADALGFGPLDAACIESMSDGELEALAERQATAVLSHSTTREAEAKTLALALREALEVHR